jgi:hypothetical protein
MCCASCSFASLRRTAKPPSFGTLTSMSRIRTRPSRRRNSRQWPKRMRCCPTQRSRENMTGGRRYVGQRHENTMVELKRWRLRVHFCVRSFGCSCHRHSSCLVQGQPRQTSRTHFFLCTFEFVHSVLFCCFSFCALDFPAQPRWTATAAQPLRRRLPLPAGTGRAAAAAVHIQMGITVRSAEQHAAFLPCHCGAGEDCASYFEFDTRCSSLINQLAIHSSINA